MEDITKVYIKLLEKNNTVTDIKNMLHSINSKLDTAKEKIVSLNTYQYETEG